MNPSGIPHLESRVPAAGAQSHTVSRDTETTHAVLMASENANTFPLESIPDVACPVVITAKKDAARNGERDRSDTTENVVVRKCIQFTVGTDIE